MERREFLVASAAAIAGAATQSAAAHYYGHDVFEVKDGRKAAIHPSQQAPRQIGSPGGWN
jgi:hypothetical protein